MDEEGIVFRGCQLPPGFRFQPTDQEIIVCYLSKKAASAAAAVTSIIADVDIYKFDPWDLPGMNAEACNSSSIPRSDLCMRHLRSQLGSVH
jgi:hypothetical protein